ncbi:MAG: S-layer homology domain-containing protein [Oscillospiraceae bacterium]|nr:S-layer homology domain-containing protein [Oscillospiraceae bacterium]
MSRKENLCKYLILGLCLALVLTFLPPAALAAQPDDGALIETVGPADETEEESEVSTVETYTTTEKGMEIIREFEGFRTMPYEDDGKWYIGYGTLCDPADYPHGIGQQSAQQLMDAAVKVAEGQVNKLLKDYKISVTQYQFDAMVSMTYNLGTQWINPDYRLCSYLIDGIENYSEPEVVNAIGTWCHQGTSVLESLVRRRLREAYLFLYGEYENDGPDMYGYINFDAAGGKVPSSTVFYPLDRPYGELPVPVQNGKEFVGWFQADGRELTADDIAVPRMEVSAKWEGAAVTTPKPKPDYSKWVNPYKDVASSDWYFTYVRELSYEGIIGGYPDGTFKAANQVTAGEALKLVLLAAGYRESSGGEGRHWAAGYLDEAVTLGCLAEGEIEDLDASIDRLTIARVAAVAMGLQPKFGDSPFADSEDGYIITLYDEEILNGVIVNGQRYYYPDRGINRGEMCAIVSRINQWNYVVEPEPEETGYIEYYGKKYPILQNVPKATYKPDLFVLDGSRMYYNDENYRTAWGIDISSYQENVDWNKVRQSGIEFVFIRIGYRGYAQAGTLNMDRYFQQNITGAKAAGLRVGAYFFSQAINPAEAAEEARYAVQALNGQTLDYPLVYDWETISADGARTKNLSNSVLTDCAIAFCSVVEQSGYIPMIYYNTPVAYTHYQLERLTDYDVWYAQYAAKPTMYYDYRIWQYSDSGTVPGVKGKCDMDLAFIPY